MNSKIILLVAVVVVGGVAFFGGMKYEQQTRASSLTARFGDAAGQFRGTGTDAGTNSQIRGNGNIASGQIISKTDSNITVKLPDGSSKIILLSNSTRISKEADGSIADLSVGTNITAAGTTNQDGSVTAQTIQIRRVMPSTPIPAK
jgi:hypothetical protein